MQKIILAVIFFTTSVSGIYGQDVLTAQVSENYRVGISSNGEQVADVFPEIQLAGDEEVSIDSWIKDPRFDAMATLPTGEQIGVSSSVSVSGSSVHVRYSFTPLKTIKVLRVMATVFLNSYTDWVGSPYQLGPRQGIVSSQGRGMILADADSGSFTLGPAKPSGLILNIKQEGLAARLVDARTFGEPSLILNFNHHESWDVPWIWKAGEEKVFDFTLSVNRPFEISPAQSLKASSDLAGYWQMKMKDADNPDRWDRLELQIKKDEKGRREVFFRDFDEDGGGENTPLKKANQTGGKIGAENDDLALSLVLDPSRTLLTGTIKTKGDGKVYPVSFSRGLDFIFPRVDADGMAVTQYTYQLPQTLTDGWPVGDLRKSPFDPQIIEKGMEEILNRQFPNIESLVLVQNGQLILDEYFKGMGPADAHQLQSATKSVLSILFGIAQDQGLVNVNDKLYDYFPEYRNKPGWDPRKDKITLGTLLSMTSGFACDDFVPATDCHWDMYKSSDWLSFVLSQPMNHEPGEHWAYCNDCLELLGAVIARKSGMSIPDFAQKYLYDPLGIHAHQWWTGPNQVTEVCGSHRLRPRDMAKLGYLYLKKGNWNGKQVVSEKWVEESTKPQAITPKDKLGNFDYGYLWWQRQMLFKDRKIRVFYAAGLGGQYIFVVPELNLVCAMTAGNYKDSGVDSALDFFKAYILGAVK